MGLQSPGRRRWGTPGCFSPVRLFSSFKSDNFNGKEAPVCRASTRGRAALGRSGPPFTVRDERIAEEDSTVKGFRKAPEDPTVAHTAPPLEGFASGRTYAFVSFDAFLGRAALKVQIFQTADTDCLLLAFASCRTYVRAQLTVVLARLLFSGERETFSGAPARTRRPADASDILPPSQAPNVVDIIHKFA